MDDEVMRLATACITDDEERECSKLNDLNTDFVFDVLSRSSDPAAPYALASFALGARDLPKSEAVAGAVLGRLKTVVTEELDACLGRTFFAALILHYRSKPESWRRDLMSRLEAWRTGDWEISGRAARALELLGDPDTESALVDALQQRSSWSVAMLAARALGRLPAIGDRSRGALADVAQHHWSFDVQAAASEALRLAEDGQGYRGIDERLTRRRLAARSLREVEVDVNPRVRLRPSTPTGSCAELARSAGTWQVRWRNTIIELSKADSFEARRRQDAEWCEGFRERCEILSRTPVDTLSFQPWERTIAPSRPHHEFGFPLRWNFYERVGQRCQRTLELPDDPERLKSVDGALLIVTERGALAVTHEGVVEPVECL